jgi:hypothetical protein
MVKVGIVVEIEDVVTAFTVFVIDEIVVDLISLTVSFFEEIVEVNVIGYLGTPVPLDVCPVEIELEYFETDANDVIVVEIGLAYFEAPTEVVAVGAAEIELEYFEALAETVEAGAVEIVPAYLEALADVVEVVNGLVYLKVTAFVKLAVVYFEAPTVVALIGGICAEEKGLVYLEAVAEAVVDAEDKGLEYFEAVAEAVVEEVEKGLGYFEATTEVCPVESELTYLESLTLVALAVVVELVLPAIRAAAVVAIP